MYHMRCLINEPVPSQRFLLPLCNIFTLLDLTKHEVRVLKQVCAFSTEVVYRPVIFVTNVLIKLI